MTRLLTALLAGLLFGAGLSLSHMTHPEKVLNFLDFTGRWDPSLALVMGGALCVTWAAFQCLLPRCATPLLATEFKLPKRSDIDKRLLVGAALFGVGWGLTGYCPGPAVAGLSLGTVEPLVVLISILAGMLIQQWLFKN